MRDGFVLVGFVLEGFDLSRHITTVYKMLLAAQPQSDATSPEMQAQDSKNSAPGRAHG